MYAYVFFNDCDRDEAQRYESLEAAKAGFAVAAADPRCWFKDEGTVMRRMPWNSPVAGVQMAERRGMLGEAEDSAIWLHFVDGDVVELTADPRGTAPRHPNADSLDD